MFVIVCCHCVRSTTAVAGINAAASAADPYPADAIGVAYCFIGPVCAIHAAGTFSVDVGVEPIPLRKGVFAISSRDVVQTASESGGNELRGEWSFIWTLTVLGLTREVEALVPTRVCAVMRDRADVQCSHNNVVFLLILRCIVGW